MVLRQTHAIWDMPGSNAVMINSSMNFAFGTGYSLEAVVMVIIILVIGCFFTMGVSRGF